MGIKFDVLYDRILLAETSEFSKFFTSSEPIKTIHNVLKVSHDTHLVLSPTNNRHELWNTLRSGKAIFASINRPKNIETAKRRLLSYLEKNLGLATGRGRDRNEVYTVTKQLVSKVTADNVSSLEYKQIKRRLMGPMPAGKKSIIELVKEIYPTDEFLSNCIEEFVTAIRPGEYILVKRVALGPTSAWATSSTRPIDRRFPIRPEEDKHKKIFGQEYVAWFFDGDHLVDKKRISINAIKVYNQLFSGWGDRDFYVVEDEKFLQIRHHPFVPSAEYNFVEIIPLDVDNINKYATNTIQKYKRVLDNKVAEIAERMRTQTFLKIQQITTPEEEIATSVQEYRDALKLLDQGVKRLDPADLFKQFIQKDTRLDLSNYLIIHADYPFQGFDPYSTAEQGVQSREDWEILNKQQGISSIEAMAKYGFGQRKDNPPDIETYNTTNENVAIAFKNLKDYNDFSRRFMQFVLRNVIKTPEVKKITGLLSGF